MTLCSKINVWKAIAIMTPTLVPRLPIGGQSERNLFCAIHFGKDPSLAIIFESTRFDSRFSFFFSDVLF